jgi:hypothetical protein
MWDVIIKKYYGSQKILCDKIAIEIDLLMILSMIIY